LDELEAFDVWHELAEVVEGASCLERVG
jgi:hypothetical protein